MNSLKLVIKTNDMQNQFKSISTELDTELNFMSLEIDDPIKLSEEAIEHISNTLNNIKIQVIETSFQLPEHEIEFFKNSKPKILSKLIYYNSIYKIETQNPH